MSYLSSKIYWFGWHHVFLGTENYRFFFQKAWIISGRVLYEGNTIIMINDILQVNRKLKTWTCKRTEVLYHVQKYINVIFILFYSFYMCIENDDLIVNYVIFLKLIISIWILELQKIDLQANLITRFLLLFHAYILSILPMNFCTYFRIGTWNYCAITTSFEYSLIDSTFFFYFHFINFEEKVSDFQSHVFFLWSRFSQFFYDADFHPWNDNGGMRRGRNSHFIFITPRRDLWRTVWPFLFAISEKQDFETMPDHRHKFHIDVNSESDPKFISWSWFPSFVSYRREYSSSATFFDLITYVCTIRVPIILNN